MTLLAVSHILAASDRDTMRFVFILIVVIFWIISAVMKAAKRAIEQQKLRESLAPRREDIARNLETMRRQQLRAGQSQRPRQLAPQIALRVPPPVRPANVSTARKPKRARPTPPPVVDQAAPQAPKAKLEADPAIVRKATIGARAPALHIWLRPSTLRQQFILMEILQSPLSLREPRF